MRMIGSQLAFPDDSRRPLAGAWHRGRCKMRAKKRTAWSWGTPTPPIRRGTRWRRLSPGGAA